MSTEQQNSRELPTAPAPQQQPQQPPAAPTARERIADELAEVRTEARQMRQGRTNFHD